MVARGDRLRADDLAIGVHCDSIAVAEIDHPAARRPREGMRVAVACDVAEADDLASIVQCVSFADSAPQSAEIDRYEGSFCRLHAPGVRGQEYREQDEHSTSRPRDLETGSRIAHGDTSYIRWEQAKRLVLRRTAQPFSCQGLAERGRSAVSSMSLAALVEENYRFEDLGVK